MIARTFIDTNVLVYAEDASAGEKQRQARAAVRDLISTGQAVVSTQILQEYFVTATRKLGLPAAEAGRMVEVLSRLDLIIVRSEHVLGAIDLHRLRSISFWDALVVKSAVAGGCSRLLTEDLQHGQIIEGLRIENPFR